MIKRIHAEMKYKFLNKLHEKRGTGERTAAYKMNVHDNRKWTGGWIDR